jgi:putative transcriptional regulator
MLIAMPGISDPRFERALILMCVHSAQEAMGITVNRTLEGLSRSELFQRLGIAGMTRPESFLVLSGGPVDRERGFVVHSDDYIASDSTLTVADGLRLTATRDILEAMSDDRRRPREAALALGCASWGAGQLEDELRENVWLTCAADPALIFDEDHDSKWARALAKLGVAPERLSAQVGRA